MVASCFRFSYRYHINFYDIRIAYLRSILLSFFVIFSINPSSAEVINLICNLDILNKTTNQIGEGKNSSKARAQVNILIGREEILKINPSAVNPPDFYINVKFADFDEHYSSNFSKSRNEITTNFKTKSNHTSDASVTHEKISGRNAFEKTTIGEPFTFVADEQSSITVNRFNGQIDIKKKFKFAPVWWL